jgi:protein O-mannosyl-transferase
MMRTGYWILLLILVAVPFATGLPHAFVYDDHGSIAENSFLDEPDAFQKLLTFQTLTDSSVPDGRRPLVVLSYLIDRTVWGLKPFGYHLTNLLLHLIVVSLVLVFVRRVQPERGPFFAFAAALLYGLHPALTEPVHCPAFREDILLTLFVLLFLLATTRQRTAWLSIPALALALLAKESAVIAPVLALWMWLCFPSTRLRRGTASAVVGVGAGLIALFAALWVKSGPLQAAASDPSVMSLAFPTNLLTAPWLWVKELRILAWPHPLIADYVITPVTQILDWRCLAGAAVLFVFAFAACALVRRAPWIAFGMGWMLIGFAPVSNVVPLYNPFAERYLYLIAIGFALVTAQLLSLLPERNWRCCAARPDEPGESACLHSHAVLLALICAAYTGLTVNRLIDWTDDMSLWSKTLLQEPSSARAHTWVGLSYKKMGEFELALKHFSEADRLNPREISGLINIAILYGQNGRFAEAEKLLREAIRRRPDKADAHWNLAVALDAQGRQDEAMAEVQETLKIDPRYPAARAIQQQLLPGGEGAR